MKKIFKSPVWLLTICMAVVVLFSLLANLVNTSAYQVKVVNKEFETENGQMEALIYTPKGCSEENPCPVIVTTHGYLNSKEMQDAPAIELSRRGYIVVAVDMYDHGGSTWDSPAEFMFYSQSVYDAATWAYNQKWTLKDAKNNGMIAVSGHSMGGFSTEMAVAMDEGAYYGMLAVNPATAYRKIAVSLSVGADYRFTEPYIPNIRSLFGPRSSGMIIGHYDEFFGDGYALGDNTVAYKNYVETAEGKSFLGLAEDAEAEAGKIYDYSGGQRVIYTPNETHPWNHFSTETTGYMIEFYDTAFEYQLEKAGLADAFTPNEKGGQTWWLKEAFEFVALVGLFAAIVPAFCLLIKVPVLCKVKTSEESLPVEKETSKGKKIALIVAAVLTSLIPAYYYPTLIYGSGASMSPGDVSLFATIAENVMYIVMVVLLGAWIIYFAQRMLKPENDPSEAKKVAWDITKGGIAIGFACLFVRYLALEANNLFVVDHYWNAPTVGQIGFWAIISAAIAVVVLTIVHFTARKRDGATIKSYGLAANVKQVLLALLIAVILFVGLYAVVFLIGWLLNTDFRLWVYAIKSFEWHHFVSFLRYLPIYFIYYFVNSIVVASNTKNVKGWKGYLYAIGLNIGGLVLFLAYQYGKLFITGTAYVPSLALEGILLFGLVPSLAVAAIFTKKFYEKTNNVWASAFFNTFLFTMITVANTTIYLLAK